MQSEITPKTNTTLRILVSVACLLGGLLAGENIFRYALEVPGWRHVDIAQWGEYSRHADLGPGIFIWPFEAISTTLLLIAASVIAFRNKNYSSTRLRVFSATALAIAGLVLTGFAAPVMLSVKTMGSDPQVLQQTFDHFHFWGSIRAVAQVLSFCCCVWALGKGFRPDVENNNTG